MGRHQKTVIYESGNDRRKIGYYSTPSFIGEFLTKKLREIFPDGNNVVDPCVGKGELVKEFARLGKEIIGIDIVDFGQQNDFVFLNHDFIDLYRNFRQLISGNDHIIKFSKFDYWLANPPYNCHEIDYIQNNKQELKKAFPEIGVHNMYSMFIAAMIDMAAEDAVIGLITLDSFLTSKAHTALRRKIINQTTIHYLILCPTDLFHSQNADVRTCIMVLQKGKRSNIQIKVCNRPKSADDFQKKLTSEKFTLANEAEILLQNPKDNLEFILEVPSEIRYLFSKLPRIGEQFACITGISTGSDRQYLSPIKKPGFSIPFYKNPGSRKFFTHPNAYLCDNFLEVKKQVRNFMVRNISFLYKSGITCSSMGVEFSACYLPANSTYGVNANIICDEDDTWWLLAYLNSKFVSYLVRGILIRTNMITSGYVARIPIPNFDESTKKELSAIAKKAYWELHNGNSLKLDEIIISITEIIYDYLNISLAAQEMINNFCKDIIRKA